MAVGESERTLIMSAASFEKTNLGWQLRQLQQQVQEWFELQFSSVKPNFPEIDWPSWSIDEAVLQVLYKLAFWLILGAFLIWLGLRLVRLWPMIDFPFLEKNISGRAANRQEREVTAATWLVRSREFQRQGNWREACRAVYMAMLQRLDETGIVAKQASRTDGEYWKLLQQQPQNAPYRTLIATHEQQCFGDAPATVEDFNRCQQAYREIQP